MTAAFDELKEKVEALEKNQKEVGKAIVEANVLLKSDRLTDAS